MVVSSQKMNSSKTIVAYHHAKHGEHEESEVEMK